MGRIPYCGYDPSSTKHPGPDLTDEAVLQAQRLRTAEDDVRRLTATVKAMESALRAAGTVLKPYLAKASNGR